MFSKSKVLSLFEARFDYASARIVLGDALAKAGVAAGSAGLEDEDLRKLAAALTALGLPRVDALVAALTGLVGTAPAGRSKAAPEPQAEVEADALPPSDEAVEAAEADQGAESGDSEAPKAKPAKGKKR